MENLTLLLKQEIKRQYKSVRQFSQHVDIPQSTIISALRKGIGGTAFDSVVKMCDVLNIKLAVNAQVYLDKEKRQLLEDFSNLDEKGKHAVQTICKVELMRCNNHSIHGYSAAFGGQDIQTNLNEENQKDAVNALRNIKLDK